MKIKLLLLFVSFITNFTFSQQINQDLNFDFTGTFNLSLENNAQVDFDQVEVFSNGFHLKSQNQLLRSYHIVGRNPKTGYELAQVNPPVSIEQVESSKLVVYPNLQGDKLVVKVYSSQGFSTLNLLKKNNN